MKEHKGTRTMYRAGSSRNRYHNKFMDFNRAVSCSMDTMEFIQSRIGLHFQLYREFGVQLDQDLH